MLYDRQKSDMHNPISERRAEETRAKIYSALAQARREAAAMSPEEQAEALQIVAGLEERWMQMKPPA